jgi:hypothetical protein
MGGKRGAAMVGNRWGTRWNGRWKSILPSPAAAKELLRKHSFRWPIKAVYSMRNLTVSEQNGGSKFSERGQINYPKRVVRTLAPPPWTGCDSLVMRAAKWIFPWTVYNYPGPRRGMVELLRGVVKYGAIKTWRRNGRHMPEWAAQMMALHIEVRCQAGLRLVEELQAYRAPEVRSPGLRLNAYRARRARERDAARQEQLDRT